MNLRVQGGDSPVSIDWSTVEEWREVADCEEVLFLNGTECIDDSVTHAKEKELAALEKYNVFKEVPYNGQDTISSRWIITEKVTNGERLVKARLVARGYEEDSNALVKYSPTGAK